MAPKELPIRDDKSQALAIGIEAVRESLADVESPYDSDKHKAARQWLDDNDIELKPLRVNNEQ